MLTTCRKDRGSLRVPGLQSQLVWPFSGDPPALLSSLSSCEPGAEAEKSTLGPFPQGDVPRRGVPTGGMPRRSAGFCQKDPGQQAWTLIRCRKHRGQDPPLQLRGARGHGGALGIGDAQSSAAGVLMSHAWSVPAALRLPPRDDLCGAQPHRRSWADGPCSGRHIPPQEASGSGSSPRRGLPRWGACCTPTLGFASSRGLARSSQPQAFGAAFTPDPQAQQQGGPRPP